MCKDDWDKDMFSGSFLILVDIVWGVCSMTRQAGRQKASTRKELKVSTSTPKCYCNNDKKVNDGLHLGSMSSKGPIRCRVYITPGRLPLGPREGVRAVVNPGTNLRQ